MVSMPIACKMQHNLLANVVLLLLEGPATNIALILLVIFFDISAIYFSWLNSKHDIFDYKFFVFGVKALIAARVPSPKLLALSRYNCYISYNVL